MKISKTRQILFDSSMQDKECNFKVLSKGTKIPEWFKEFKDDFDSFKKEVNTRFDKQEEFNKQIIARLDRIDKRIDNLIAKNNLKE